LLAQIRTNGCNDIHRQEIRMIMLRKTCT